jgi:Ca2+-binding RTX toxin-like protein
MCRTGSRRIASVAGLCAVVLGASTAAVAASSGSATKNVIVFTASNSTINVPGNDTVYDLGSHNTILGGGGNNDIYPGPGDDVHGGRGVNAVLYTERSSAVAVTLDNKPNDGTTGDAANIHTDVEQIYGGSGDNRLIGDLQPGAPSELIQGGSGNNFIVGGSGRNRIYGGPGKNTINSFNGKVDVVNCGGGNSTVTPDAFDILIGCRHRASPPRITSPIDFTFSFKGDLTAVLVLNVRGVPNKARLEVRCNGGGCPFSVKRPKLRHGSTALAPLFSGAHLHAGARIEIRITKPNIVLQNAIGKVDVFTMGHDAAPSLSKLCLSPGTSKPSRSC